MAAAYALAHKPEKGAGNEAAECATKDIEGEMDTQIDAGVAGEACPAEEQKAGGSVTEHEGEEHGCTKGVGRMAGDETVKSAAIAVYHIHQGCYLGGTGGTEPVEIGLAQAARELVGEDHKQDGRKDDGEAHAGALVLEEHIYDSHQQGHPCEGLCECPHQTVHEERVAAVEGKQQFLVKGNQLFEHSACLCLSDDFEMLFLYPAHLAVGYLYLSPVLQAAVANLHSGAFVQDEEVVAAV